MIVRLGGMHAFMSLVGSIGTHMAEFRQAEFTTPVSDGVGKLLSRKKFPQNE